MDNIRTQEDLQIWLIHFLGEKFPQNAILKGGMAMKLLLNCPRYTNDLDYVFVPFKSRKDIMKRLCEALAKVDFLVVSSTHQHSNAFVIVVQTKTEPIISTAIEFNVELECNRMPVSTSRLAATIRQPSQLVNVTNPQEAMAHKMAAWLERDLVRDLYDIYFFIQSGFVPDRKTLESRLANVKSQNKRRKLPPKMTIDDFAKHLEARLERLSDAELDTLRALLPQNEIILLKTQLNPTLHRLAKNLVIQ